MARRALLAKRNPGSLFRTTVNMSRSLSLEAANDNALGRPVVVSIPRPDGVQLSILADIFAGLLVDHPVAANDNAPARRRQDR